MVATQRVPTMADLEAYAYEMRGRFAQPIYIWGEPGVIRWGRREPESPMRFVIVGPSGRIWRITRAS